MSLNWVRSIQGTIEFDSNVVATIFSTALSIASDPVLQNPNVDYVNPNQRGLESGQDFVTFSGNQVSVNLLANIPGDYFRVITAATPKQGDIDVRVRFGGEVGTGLFSVGTVGIPDLSPQENIVTLTSENPSIALLSPVGSYPPKSSIDIPFTGSLTLKTFELHGISQGLTDIVGTSPRLNSDRQPVRVVPAEVTFSSDIPIIEFPEKHIAFGPEHSVFVLLGITPSTSLEDFAHQFVSPGGVLDPLPLVVSISDSTVGQLRERDSEDLVDLIEGEIPQRSSAFEAIFVPKNPGTTTLLLEAFGFSLSKTIEVIQSPSFNQLLDTIESLNLDIHAEEHLLRFTRKAISAFTDGNIKSSRKWIGMVNKRITQLKKTNRISTSDAASLTEIVESIGIELALFE